MARCSSQKMDKRLKFQEVSPSLQAFLCFEALIAKELKKKKNNITENSNHALFTWKREV